MSAAAWVIVEQDEGLMVNTTRGGDIEVFEVDYDEAKNNDRYTRSKIAECANSRLPQDHKDRIIKILEGYL
jgi:hypothetical protein